MEMKAVLSLVSGAIFSLMYVTPSNNVTWWVEAVVCIGIVGYIKWQG